MSISDCYESDYHRIKKLKLNINMERGWPCDEQLRLSLPMLDLVDSNTELCNEVDYRGYAGNGGILPLKKLFADILEVQTDNIYIGGTMSTTIMYDIINKMYCLGKDGSVPWCKLDKVKFICPSPGYEKHFKICQTFNIEMIPVTIGEDGPDMDTVEKLVCSDVSIKGIWCVPLYSNPTGIIYSDEIIKRISMMHTAADDFIVMWDNAYCVHHLTDKKFKIANIIDICEQVGNKNRVFEFTSTSKITFPGAGVGVCASSVDNIEWIKKNTILQFKTGDKINQLRHALFLKDKETVAKHMEKHAAIIKPKFDLMDKILHERISGIKGIKWNNPEGGYFMHIELLPHMATSVWRICKDLGVAITPAGSTFPYGKEADDKTIRLAPTYLDNSALEIAMEVFCYAINKVYSELYEV